MVFGKRFTAYMNNYPNADKPSANRCSKLSYNELRSIAKNLYRANDDAKNELYNYPHMNRTDLSNSVYHAMGTLLK